MQRRKFIAAVGTVAAGSTAIVGSGAFSAAQMNREADINVVNDHNGLIALRVGPNVESDVVREKNGEILIDFNPEDSGTGVNINSRYQVGAFDTNYEKVPDGALESEAGSVDDGDDYALSVVNQDTTDHDVRIAYEANDTGDFHGANVYFQCVPFGDTNSGTHSIGVSENNGNNVDAMSNTIPSGEEYRLVLLVDTRGAEGVDPEDVDLSGTLKISA